MTRSAQLVIFLIAILLALPVIAMPSAKRLSLAQQRTVAELPATDKLTAQPRLYFAALNDFFADNNWLALHAANLRQDMYLSIGGTGSNQVVRNGDFHFISRHGPGQPEFSAIGNACRLAEPDPQAMARLTSSYQYIRTTLEAHGIVMRVLIVPSKPVLYADRLRGRVPLRIETMCLEASKGRGRSAALAAAFPLDAENVGVSYPLERFVSKRDEPHYFPPENFHANGKAAFDAAQTIAPKPTAQIVPKPELQRANADMTAIYGQRRISMWIYDYAEFDISNYLDVMVARTWTPFQVKNLYRATRTTNSLTDRTAVIFADSFGDFVFEHLAPYYKELSLMPRTGAQPDDFVRALLWVQSEQSPPAEVIFIVHDGGIPLLNIWADAIKEGQTAKWAALQ